MGEFPYLSTPSSSSAAPSAAVDVTTSTTSTSTSTSPAFTPSAHAADAAECNALRAKISSLLAALSAEQEINAECALSLEQTRKLAAKHSAALNEKATELLSARMELRACQR